MEVSVRPIAITEDRAAVGCTARAWQPPSVLLVENAGDKSGVRGNGTRARQKLTDERRSQTQPSLRQNPELNSHRPIDVPQ
jgi:hypothetical protein